jgi:alkaline phosphatase D
MAAIDQARLSDVVVLGGDVHYNMAGRLRLEPNNPASPVLASEFVTTSISSRGMSNARLQMLRGSNPDMVFARSDQRGYTLVDLTPKTARSEFRASSTVDTDTAPLAVQAAYVVEAGRPGVLPA